MLAGDGWRILWSKCRLEANIANRTGYPIGNAKILLMTIHRVLLFWQQYFVNHVYHAVIGFDIGLHDIGGTAIFVF